MFGRGRGERKKSLKLSWALNVDLAHRWETWKEQSNLNVGIAMADKEEAVEMKWVLYLTGKRER